MDQNAPLCVGFLGLGLIGGSIARTVRKQYPDAEIIAYNRSEDSLKEAVKDGVVNVPVREVGAEFGRCGIVFLCCPVSVNDEMVLRVKPHLAEDAILTDIGSVKTDIHNCVVRAGLQRLFIGGHPMTGTERTKYRNSSAVLLENAYYILTPEPEVPAEKVRFFTDFVRSLGALPLTLSNQYHDFAVAAVSHVPHVISASLVNLVRESDDPSETLRTIAAGGFRDITRISSSSPVMWQQICLTNRDNILTLLGRYIHDLEKAEDLIRDRDADGLYALFDTARRYRDTFNTAASGPIRQTFVLYINIADRPGVLAEVAGILAQENVNILNIGITHNREYADGVLRLELHNADGLRRAEEILHDRGYEVHTAV